MTAFSYITPNIVLKFFDTAKDGSNVMQRWHDISKNINTKQNMIMKGYLIIFLNEREGIENIFGDVVVFFLFVIFCKCMKLCKFP